MTKIMFWFVQNANQRKLDNAAAQDKREGVEHQNVKDRGNHKGINIERKTWKIEG